MKTPAATAMAGAQTAINNQLKAATATATMTATTSFVELYWIYCYYLFIYHYVNCDVALSCCRYRQSIRIAATALPPSRCAPPPRFALPPPPLTLPPPPHHRQAAANVALARCCHRRHCAVALLPMLQTLPLPPLTPPCCCRRRAFALPPLPQPPRCCHRAAAVALCAAALLRAATTAAAPPPSCRQRRAVALLPPLQQLQWPTEAERCNEMCEWECADSVSNFLWQNGKFWIWKQWFLASAYLHTFQKHTNSYSTWKGYSCYKYKKTNTRIGNIHFLLCIRIFAQEKHLFYKFSQNGYAKEQPRPKQCFAQSFAYPRIRVSG
jgi:hypothetical protein